MKIFIKTAIFIFLALSALTAHAATSRTIHGWAWSDNIGWISMDNNNCDGTNCTKSVYDYGVDSNPSTGLLYGYAWSDNIGWISFNPADLTGCPSGTCSATIANNKLTGWARALAVSSADDTNCPAKDPDNDGCWDGWISFSGTNPNYGVTIGSASNNKKPFSGYAWGSDVVGWVDMSKVYMDDNVPKVTIDAHFYKPNSGNNVDPIIGSTLIKPNYSSVAIVWSATGATSCAPNSYQSLTKKSAPFTKSTATAGTETNGDKGFILPDTTSFSITCVNSSNNTKATATVVVNVLYASLSATPSGIKYGMTSNLHWQSNGGLCVALSSSYPDDASWTDTLWTGGATLSPTKDGYQDTSVLNPTPQRPSGYDYTYTLKCYNDATKKFFVTDTAVVHVSDVIISGATVTLTADPTYVNSGKTSKLSWSVANAASGTCVATSSGSNGGTDNTWNNLSDSVLNVASGTQSTDALTEDMTYTLSCDDSQGITATATATVSITGLTLSVTPSIIDKNNLSNVSVSWSNTDTSKYSCTRRPKANSTYLSSGAVNGDTVSDSPTVYTLYSYTCTNKSTGKPETVTAPLYVASLTPTQSIVAMDASNTSPSGTMTLDIPNGDNTISCIPGWKSEPKFSYDGTAKILSFTFFNKWTQMVITPTVTCQRFNENGATDPDTVLLNTVLDIISLDVNPKQPIEKNTNVDLTWTTSAGVASCTGSGTGWSGSKTPVSSQTDTVSVGATTTFSLACTDANGKSATANALVNVNKPGFALLPRNQSIKVVNGTGTANVTANPLYGFSNSIPITLAADTSIGGCGTLTKYKCIPSGITVKVVSSNPPNPASIYATSISNSVSLTFTTDPMNPVTLDPNQVYRFWITGSATNATDDTISVDVNGKNFKPIYKQF